MFYGEYLSLADAKMLISRPRRVQAYVREHLMTDRKYSQWGVRMVRFEHHTNLYLFRGEYQYRLFILSYGTSPGQVVVNYGSTSSNNDELQTVYNAILRDEQGAMREPTFVRDMAEFIGRQVRLKMLLHLIKD